MSSLFLFGHIQDTPLARSLVLVPVGGRNKFDRHGVVTGASAGDTLFVSPCYLKRLADNARRQDFEQLLGEREAASLHDQFGDAIENIQTRSHLVTSIPRDGGP